jgi:RNA recognition motif-containing protein
LRPSIQKSRKKGVIMNIYVGNLSFQLTEEELEAAFKAFGEVTSVNIIRDRFSGQSKGFGFVEMAVQAEAERAVRELDGSELKGRNIKVNEAKPRTDRPPRSRRQY